MQPLLTLVSWEDVGTGRPPARVLKVLHASLLAALLALRHYPSAAGGYSKYWSSPAPLNPLDERLGRPLVLLGCRVEGGTLTVSILRTYAAPWALDLTLVVKRAEDAPLVVAGQRLALGSVLTASFYVGEGPGLRVEAYVGGELALAAELPSGGG